MKAYIRELLPDIKAAARIGHPESLQVALDGVRALSEVGANARMPASFIETVLVPLGLALSSPALDAALLQDLLQDPFAGVRSLTAIALGDRFARGEALRDAVLKSAGMDTRQEVRLGLALGLSRAPEDTGRVVALLRTWLEDRSPRLRECVLLAIPSLQENQALELCAAVCALKVGENEDVDKALVAALISLADRGAGERVLACLEAWAQLDEPPVWVITRTMMKSWIGAYPQRAAAILDAMQSRLGPVKEIMACREFAIRAEQAAL